MSAPHASDSVADRVRRIVAGSLCVLEAHVTDDASLACDLGANNGDRVLLAHKIEDAFDVEVNVAVDSWLTVGDVVEWTAAAVVARADR